MNDYQEKRGYQKGPKTLLDYIGDFRDGFLDKFGKAIEFGIILYENFEEEIKKEQEKYDDLLSIV